MHNWRGSCTALEGGVRNTCKRTVSKGSGICTALQHELTYCIPACIGSLTHTPTAGARQPCVARIDGKSGLMSGAGHQTERTCLESIHRRPAGSECPEGKCTTRYLLISGMSISQAGGAASVSPQCLQWDAALDIKGSTELQVLCDTSPIIYVSIAVLAIVDFCMCNFCSILTSMQLPLCW